MRSVMEQHEREFFICNIRLGITNVGKGVVIKPLTLEQESNLYNVYNEAYDESLSLDIMTNDSMQDWMYQNNLWDENDEAEIKNLEKDLEYFKVDIYNSRKDKRAVALLKHKLKKANQQLVDKAHVKNQYFHTTCEGVAESAKIAWIIENTTYKDDKLYDFSEFSEDYVTSCYYKGVFTEHQIRDLVLNDPWRSIWGFRKNTNVPLFKNLDTYELTYNQKHILTWSQLYENIAESAEPPTDMVIKDHDMLDGWFIVQDRKRKKEDAEKELEQGTKSERIKNASEVFVMAKDKEDIANIHGMNDNEGRAIKKQREELINKKGTVEQHEFIDERIDMTKRQSEMYKDKFRR